MSATAFQTITRAALVAALFGVGSLFAATLPERRPQRPSSSVEVAPSATASSASVPTREELVDLYTEIQLLQEQLRELRGQLEVQAHQIERLNRRQMESTIDFDRRLREGERRSATPPTASQVPAPAATTSTPTSTLDEQKQYDAAFALMKQGQYDQARKNFREFVARHPKSTLADNAQYWVGEMAYVARDFRGALDEFNKILTNYPGSPKTPDAMLKIGYVQQELGTPDKARETLRGVIAKFPNTAVAKAAEQRLAKLPK